MLIYVPGKADAKYFVHTHFDLEAVQLNIICNSRVYFAPLLNSDNKPAPRKNQSWEDYVNTLRQALECYNAQLFEYDINCVDDGLSNIEFTIKEFPKEGSTIKTLLYRSSFALKTQNESETSMNTILMSTCTLLQNFSNEVQLLKSLHQENQSVISSLTQDVDSSTKFKDNLQTNLIKKFLVLLNSKKRRIAELESDEATLPIMTMSTSMNNDKTVSSSSSSSSSCRQPSISTKKRNSSDNSNCDDSVNDPSDTSTSNYSVPLSHRTKSATRHKKNNKMTKSDDNTVHNRSSNYKRNNTNAMVSDHHNRSDEIQKLQCQDNSISNNTENNDVVSVGSKKRSVLDRLLDDSSNDEEDDDDTSVGR